MLVQVRIQSDVLIFVWRVLGAEFVVFISTSLNICVSIDDLKVVFGDATDKEGECVVQRDEVRFISNKHRTVARDYCCVVVL